MATALRNGKRWTVNELLQLQRDFELLELSISEIALKHQRTEKAILLKLVNEGFMDETALLDNSAVVDNNFVDNELDCDNTESHDVRLYRLECAVDLLSHVVEDLRKSFVPSKKVNNLYA